MPTLANINGASLVPDLSGSLNLLLNTFGTKQSRDREAAELQRQQDLQALIGEALGATGPTLPPGVQGIVPGLEGAQTFPLDEAPESGAAPVGVEGIVPGLGGARRRARTVDPRTQQAALARLAAIDPKVAKEVGAILQRGDERELAAVQRETEKGTRLAAHIQSQPDYQSKRAAIMEAGQAAAAQGEPVDRYIELANLPEAQLNLALRRMMVQGADLKTLTDQALGPRKPPDTREIKRGDEIVTEQFNPQTGEFEEVARGPRFNPRAGVTVNVGGSSPTVTDRPLTAEEVARFNLNEADATGLVVDDKGRLKPRPSPEQSVGDAEIEKAGARREAGISQGLSIADAFEHEAKGAESVGGVVVDPQKREALNQQRNALVAWTAKNILGTPGAEPSPSLYEKADDIVPDFSGPMDRMTFDKKMKTLRELMQAGRKNQGGDKKRLRFDAQGNPVND